MSDEDAPKKKDTKGTKRTKRDPNQPVPKPRGSLLKKALYLSIGGCLSIVLLWGALYSTQIGKTPNDWSSEEWSGFLTFSKQQVDEARQNVESVDWNALKDKVTEKTKELWNDVPAWEQKLEAKLA